MPKKKTTKKTTGKKTASKKATQGKAEFIRSHANLKPADLVVKAKEAGISITPDYVHKTRSLDRKVGKAPSTKTAANGTPTAKGRGDKKNLVLKLVAQHPGWSKKQIATAAKCTPNYVYSVLSDSGQAAGKNTTGASASNGTVTAFYRAVKSVGGIGKAKELLANIEAFQNA